MAAPIPPSTLYTFKGHTDVKQLALYVQDTITKGPWSLNLGLRGDFYNGLTTHREAEPRLGIAYNIKKTSTVLRVSYARVLETPFNENLVLSSVGCDNAVLNPLLGCFEASLAVLEQYEENPYAVRLRLRFVLKRRLHQDDIEAQTRFPGSPSMTLERKPKPEQRIGRMRQKPAARPPLC
jgi:TonB dependent receptor